MSLAGLSLCAPELQQVLLDWYARCVLPYVVMTQITPHFILLTKATQRFHKACKLLSVIGWVLVVMLKITRHVTRLLRQNVQNNKWFILSTCTFFLYPIFQFIQQLSCKCRVKCPSKKQGSMCGHYYHPGESCSNKFCEVDDAEIVKLSKVNDEDDTKKGEHIWTNVGQTVLIQSN